MIAMSSDPLEPNFLALYASIRAEISAQKALECMGLYEQYQVLMPEDRQKRDAEISRRYKAGQKPGDIARDMGLHTQTVYNVTKEAR